MSSKGVEQVIGRALIDPGYRDLLLDRPEEALSGYDLTGEEAAALKGLGREQFAAIIHEVEERVLRSGLVLRDLEYDLQHLESDGIRLSDVTEIVEIAKKDEDK